MSKPTDTSQASEDELMRELRLLYGRRISSNLSLAEYFLEMRQLIRTEKLKLLAEVREQIKAGGYDTSYEISVVNKLEAEL